MECAVSSASIGHGLTSRDSPEGTMTFALNKAELTALVDAARVLTTPLDYESSDAWRAAVNRHVRTLLAGDTAGFLLPGVGGTLFFTEDHDPAEIAKYPELEVPA